MGTNQLGDNIKNSIDALAPADKEDRTKLMRALGNPIEDWHTNGEYEYIVYNAYYDGSWKYISNGIALLTRLDINGLIYYTAASGVADNPITWIKRFRIEDNANIAGLADYSGSTEYDSKFYLSKNTYFNHNGANLYSQNENGYINISCQNISYAHLYTDTTGIAISGKLVFVGNNDLGSSVYYCTNLNYKVLIDRTGTWLEDSENALQFIRDLENEEDIGYCKMIEDLGKRRLKFSKLPNWMWENEEYIAEEDIIFDEIKHKINHKSFEDRNKQAKHWIHGEKIVKKGEKTRIIIDNNEVCMKGDGLHVDKLISFMLGATRGLVEKVDILEAKNKELEMRIEALEAKLNG